MLLPFDRYCEEIVAQTDLLRAHAKDTDMTAPVPSCPGWNVGQLLRHVGGDHRWAATAVQTRATEPVSDKAANDLAGYADEDWAVLDPWLAEGASRLAACLHEAGPGVEVWNPSDIDRRTADFWARRMTFETAVHRADAALATGVKYTLGEDVAIDGVDEWMEFATVPEAYEPGPDAPGLLGPGRTLQFHAGEARWLVDLTRGKPTSQRDGAADKPAVTVRGPATDVLMLLYRRPAPRVEVDGDAGLLDLWLTRTGFWLA
ncbi:maleylpyruvate isomerase family mycothiol-dependent enzyme [Actinomadura welshii]|uniref:maleylpyruvate isomerase family mycothiol-dependent enzyme n=1 Tax=Actinomadura welshii TaxID=3103817 RepID=UPI0003AD612D|nr:maleylpyruvate isomerase family mycothiol-dependent enzyme [Actinomadura madurae]